ncbi:PAS domain-containing protein [Pedobacter frigoris]|uniref:PAS domain-containing protein n=1 Tax=Pedobacter frigoris TaxID=2571272 RepID=UPI00292FD208|nr:PAS domain-containing protein [Pedobacter frigoris]
MASRFNMFSSVLETDKVNLLSYWDKDLICRFANKEFFKLIDKPSEELIGKTDLKTLLGIAYDLHYPYIKSVLNGHSQNYESEIYLQSGERYSIIATYYPDIEDGEVVGFFAHITNFKQFTSQNQDTELRIPYLNGESKNVQNMIIQNNKIYEVAGYLKSQILSDFPSIEQLADLHFISVSKLMRDFKHTFHTSPYLYYRKLQMEFAEQYIEKTGCSKKQISMMLGFSNPANFGACFKRYINDRTVEKFDSDFAKDINEKNKILITQFPLAVAMLDKQMNYLVFSKQWAFDFRFTNVELIGHSIFDFFPGTTEDLEKVRGKYLSGGIAHCGGEYYIHGVADNRVLKCIIKQWYTEAGDLGGLIVYSI